MNTAAAFRDLHHRVDEKTSSMLCIYVYIIGIDVCSVANAGYCFFRKKMEKYPSQGMLSNMIYYGLEYI